MSKKSIQFCAYPVYIKYTRILYIIIFTNAPKLKPTANCTACFCWSFDSQERTTNCVLFGYKTCCLSAMTQLELPPPAQEHLPLSLSCIQMCPKSSKFKATKPNAACLNTFQIKPTKNKTRFLQIFRAMGVLYPKLYTLM